MQESGSCPEPQEKRIALKNVSPLQLTPLLETSFPFYLDGCHGARSHIQVRTECNGCCSPTLYSVWDEWGCMDVRTSLSVPLSLSLSLSLSALSVCLSVQKLNLGCGAQAQVSVTFDPSYCSDKLSRREEKQLSITFREHAHRVRGVLCGTGQPAHTTSGVKC